VERLETSLQNQQNGRVGLQRFWMVGIRMLVREEETVAKHHVEQPGE